MEKKKIKQIRTIAQRVSTSDNTDRHCWTFDHAVNEALAEGWYLVKRYALPAHTDDRFHMLIAELQRFVENE